MTAAASPGTEGWGTAYAIGVDIGGTNLKTVTVTPAGELLYRSSEPSQDAPDAAGYWVARVREQIAWIEGQVGQPATAVGLSAPGLAAADGRSIAWMRGRMEAIQGLDWTQRLDRACPVLNDAQAALLGEVWRGAAVGSRNALLLTLGTGVGGAALVDGRLLRGHLGRAGHLGHISLDPNGPPDIVGTPGSLEDALGECSLAARTGGRFTTTEDLVRAHQEGETGASDIWLRSVRALAAGIASLVNVLDPEVVVLGGGIAGAGDDLLEPLEQYLDAWEWRPTSEKVRLVLASLGEFAGAYGAAIHSLNEAASP